MSARTLNGVTVTVSNEKDGRPLSKWIIVSIVRKGLPAIIPNDHSYESEEQAFEAGFQKSV